MQESRHLLEIEERTYVQQRRKAMKLLLLKEEVKRELLKVREEKKAFQRTKIKYFLAFLVLIATNLLSLYHWK